MPFFCKELALLQGYA